MGRVEILLPRHCDAKTKGGNAEKTNHNGEARVRRSLILGEPSLRLWFSPGLLVGVHHALRLLFDSGEHFFAGDGGRVDPVEVWSMQQFLALLGEFVEAVLALGGVTI